MKFYAHIDNGKLIFYNRSDFDSWLKQQADGKFEIEFKRPNNKRSIEQNRLYWAYISILSAELGYEREEMHEIVKCKFLKREKVDENTGEVFEYLKSTTKLSKAEFTEFIQQLQIWAAQTLNIVLPDPLQQMKLINQ